MVFLLVGAEAFTIITLKDFLNHDLCHHSSMPTQLPTGNIIIQQSTPHEFFFSLKVLA